METRYIDDKMQKVWAALLGIEAFFIIFSNITAMRIFMRKKFTICKSSYLLVNLTIADILVGFAALCVLLEVLYARESMYISCGNVINTISFTFSIFTLIASLNSLALMAFERALAIVIPFRFRHVKTKHYAVCIAVSWCLSMLVLLRNYYCSSKGSSRTVLWSFNMVVVITSILTIVLSYTAIYIRVKCRPSIQVNTTMRNNIRLTKTILMTTLVALCTWLPRYIAHMLKNKLSIVLSDDVNIFLSILIYSNSFANLFVYAFRMPAFRKELKNMVMSKCHSLSPTNKVYQAEMQVQEPGNNGKDINSEKYSDRLQARSSQTVSCSKVIVSV